MVGRGRPPAGLDQGSTDSRHFGPVRREQLKAKVLLIYWPNDRRKLL
jgi:hypothetical protein